MGYKSLNPEPSTSAIYRYKVLTTFIFCYGSINLAIVNCILSSILPDFRHRVGITNEEFGRLEVVTGIFSVATGLLSGIYITRYRQKTFLLLAMSYALCSIGHLFLPFSRNIYEALVFLLIRGIPKACINSPVSAYVVSMWGQESSMWIHMVHFGYSIGCVIAPMIAGPFLSKTPLAIVQNVTATSGNFTDIGNTSLLQNESVTQIVYSTMLDYHSNNNTTTHSDLHENVTPILPYSNITPGNIDDSSQNIESGIEVPFIIGSLTMFSASILLCLLHCNIIRQPMGYKLSQPATKSLKATCNPNTCAPGKPCFAMFMIVVFFLFYPLLSAVEGAITNQFMFTYAVEGHFKFTNREADMLDIAYKACYLLGRILIIPIARFVSIPKIIFTELICSFVLSIGIATIGTQSRTSFWILINLFSIFVNPIWPGGYAWFDRYIYLYTVVISVSDIFTTASYTGTSVLAGRLLDGNQPESIWTLMAVLCGALLLVTAIGQIVASRHGPRQFENEAMDIGNTGEANEGLLRKTDGSDSENHGSCDETEH